MTCAVKAAWQDLLDKDDRNSPVEYPEMALITFDEFAAYIAEAISAERERCARIAEHERDLWRSMDMSQGQTAAEQIRNAIREPSDG